MSDLEEKLQQQRAQAGRARQSWAQHLRPHAAHQVRYVGEPPKPALEVLAESKAGTRGGAVPELVALHLMPRVTIWERLPGGAESEWWFQHVMTLVSEWDEAARAWMPGVLQSLESHGWPVLSPRAVPEVQGEAHEPESFVRAVVVPLPPRRRRAPSSLR